MVLRYSNPQFQRIRCFSLLSVVDKSQYYEVNKEMAKSSVLKLLSVDMTNGPDADIKKALVQTDGTASFNDLSTSQFSSLLLSAIKNEDIISISYLLNSESSMDTTEAGCIDRSMTDQIFSLLVKKDSVEEAKYIARSINNGGGKIWTHITGDHLNDMVEMCASKRNYTEALAWYSIAARTTTDRKPLVSKAMYLTLLSSLANKKDWMELCFLLGDMKCLLNNEDILSCYEHLLVSQFQKTYSNNDNSQKHIYDRAKTEVLRGVVADYLDLVIFCHGHDRTQANLNLNDTLVIAIFQQYMQFTIDLRSTHDSPLAYRSSLAENVAFYQDSMLPKCQQLCEIWGCDMSALINNDLLAELGRICVLVASNTDSGTDADSTNSNAILYKVLSGEGNNIDSNTTDTSNTKLNVMDSALMTNICCQNLHSNMLTDISFSWLFLHKFEMLLEMFQDEVDDDLIDNSNSHDMVTDETSQMEMLLGIIDSYISDAESTESEGIQEEEEEHVMSVVKVIDCLLNHAYIHYCL